MKKIKGCHCGKTFHTRAELKFHRWDQHPKPDRKPPPVAKDFIYYKQTFVEGLHRTLHTE